MRNMPLPVILPDQDSDDLQLIYRSISDLVERYNADHVSVISSVQFDFSGAFSDGIQRDYRGCYVSRPRCDVV